MNCIKKHQRVLIIVAVVLVVFVAGGLWFMNDLPDSVFTMLIEQQVAAYYIPYTYALIGDVHQTSTFPI
jgi:hypothetical protein